MTIWWCEEHGGQGTDAAKKFPGPDKFVACWVIKDYPDTPHPCRFVEMQLVPVQPSPAPYDIEIPDFVNRHGTW